MKRSSSFGLRLFTSAFLILFTFAQPLLAIESLAPVPDAASTESVVTDTEEDILDEGISDPEEIAKPTWVTSGESASTSFPVVVGEVYTYPINPAVTLTFSKLPTVSSTLTIKTIYLTDDQVKATNAASDVAYDIATDMTDGTFEYDLTLPKIGDNNKVIYAENISGLLDDSAKDIGNIIDNGNSLTVENLDHFTIFVITNVDQATFWDWITRTGEWTRKSIGNANSSLTQPTGNVLDTGRIIGLGSDYVKMVRPTTGGRTFLGYDAFDSVKLKDTKIQNISWQSYSNQSNLDQYLNIYLSKNFSYKSIVYVPGNTVSGQWATYSTANPGTFRVTNDNTTYTNFASILTAYKDWYITTDPDAYSGLVIVSGSSTSTYNLENYVDNVIISYDNGQNDTFFFENTADNVKPSVIITPTLTSPTNAASIIFNVIFNENVYGLESTDFSISNGDISGLTQIDPSHYNLSVSTSHSVAGNITISLPADIVSDESGNGNIASSNSSIFFDNIAPILNVSGLQYIPGLFNYFSTNDTTPTLIGVISEDSWENIENLLMYATVDAIPVGVNSTSGNWFINLPTLPDGNHTVSITATDEANNQTILSQNIVIDSSAPTATYRHFNNGIEVYETQYVKTISQLEFQGGYSDSAPSSGLIADSYVIFQAQNDGTFAYQNNGKLAYCGWRNLNNTLTLGGSSSEISSLINFSNCNTNLPDGEYYMAHQVYDNAYRLDIAPINQFRDVLGLKFVVDATAPSVPMHGLPNKSIIPTNNFDFTWDASNDASAITYEFQSSMDPPQSGGVLTTGLWKSIDNSIVLSTPTIHSSGAPDGTWYWQVRAKDAADNYSNWSEIWDITLDTVAPSKPAIANTTAFTNINAITVNWTGGDDQGQNPTGIKGYSIRYVFTPANGGPDINWTSGLVLSGNPHTRSGSFGHGEGKYVIYVKTIDMAGNESPESDSYTTTYDATAPDVEITAPTSTHLTGIVEVRGTVTDVNPHHYWFVITNSIGTQVAGLGTVNDTSSFTDKFLLNWDTASLPEGNYTIKLEARDAANNKDSDSVNWLVVTVDHTQPTVDLQLNVFDTGLMAVFSEDVNQADAENAANYFLNNWPTAVGTGDLLGDASISYDSVTHTATVTFTNGGWYISPEQQWGVQDIHDLAGNILVVTPYTESSTPMVAPITTATGIDLNWHNTDVIVNLVCTDDDGSGCYKTYYSLNSGPKTEGNTVLVSSEGENTITYSSTDNAGNEELLKTSETVKIDKINPTADVLAALSFTTGVTTPRFLSLNDNNELAQVCYVIDTNTQTCLPLFGKGFSWDITALINTLGVGTHAFTYYVVDTAGNRSDSDSIIDGSNPYASSVTVAAIPQETEEQVQGVTTRNNAFATDPITTERQQEETPAPDEIVVTDDTEEVQGTQDTATDGNGKQIVQWWVYALGGTAFLSFLIFLIARRRRKENEY